MQTADHNFYTTTHVHSTDTKRDSSQRTASDGNKYPSGAGQQHNGVAGRMMNVIAVAIDATLGRYDR